MKPHSYSITLPVACLLLVTAACSERSSFAERSKSTDNPYAHYVSTSYQGTTNWLCHPQLTAARNVCNADLDSTFVEADGTATVETFSAAPDPQVDCFYVYPTTSADPGANSDFNPDVQENQTTALQAARYGATCRLFAPVYRQRTTTRLTLDSATEPLGLASGSQEAIEMAYGDVVDAFREYIAHLNQGRGFLLLGHSQGARHLARLMAEEVEAHPYLMERLIAAHIPGTIVDVPVGADIGGTLKAIPACRDTDQTGCVITYASYRAGDPELSDPRFGVTATPGMQALCVNPAALTGGAGALDVYLPFILPPVFQALLIPRGIGPYANPVSNATALLDAPFFSVPGQISGECVVNDAGTSYLEVRIEANPDDPRADNYPGEFIGGTGWGLHLADVNLAQGNLVELARTQSEAWLQGR